MQVQVCLRQQPKITYRHLRTRPSPEQTLDPAHALRQVVVAERIGEPQVAAGSERLAGGHRDLSGVEDELGELRARRRGAAVDLPPEDTPHRRIGVEGTSRLRTHDT